MCYVVASTLLIRHAWSTYDIGHWRDRVSPVPYVVRERTRSRHDMYEASFSKMSRVTVVLSKATWMYLGKIGPIGDPVLWEVTGHGGIGTASNGLYDSPSHVIGSVFSL